MRAFRSDVHGVKRLAGRDEEAIAFWAAETDVAGSFRQNYLSDALSFRREDVNAVKAFTGPACARPDVAVNVRAHAVSAAVQHAVLRLELHDSELSPIRQLLPIH